MSTFGKRRLHNTAHHSYIFGADEQCDTMGLQVLLNADAADIYFQPPGTTAARTGSASQKTVLDFIVDRKRYA